MPCNERFGLRTRKPQLGFKQFLLLIQQIERCTQPDFNLDLGPAKRDFAGCYLVLRCLNRPLGGKCC